MKLLPFLLLLAAVLGCRQMAEKPQTETRPPEPAQAVDARTLIADYKANEVSADGHYRGKLLEVTGVVDRVSDIGGVVHVSLKDGNDGFLTIDCAFTDYDPHVRGLSADIPATLYGVGDGMTLNLYVGLTDCKVK
jgi:hypothetical protein